MAGSFKLLKPSLNKEGQKFFQVHRFRVSSFTADSWEKDTENSAPGNFFGPSYFETALNFHENGNNIRKELDKRETKAFFHI